MWQMDARSKKTERKFVVYFGLVTVTDSGLSICNVYFHEILNNIPA